MARVSGWLAAGLLTAGVSAAMFAGAGIASANGDGDSGSEPAKVSSTNPDGNSDAPPAHRGLAGVRVKGTRADLSAAGDATTSRQPRQSRHAAALEQDPVGMKAFRLRAVGSPPRALAGGGAERTMSARPAQTKTKFEQRLTHVTSPHPAAAIDEVAPLRKRTTVTLDVPQAAAIDTTNSIPVIGPFPPKYPPLVRAIGSALFNLIGAVVQTVDGRPVIPPELRDSIQVSSSTLVITPGTVAPADWYFPTTGNPDHLIYLQHGILASGPMYSYTASYLAERTNSVVVATTITSNLFAKNGMWVGGDNMHNAVAQLFLDDDLTALNTSLTMATLEAGHQELTVPSRFVLVGHSLGGGYVPGVAGHYAEGLVVRRADGLDASNELEGVVMLDGVPISPILPNAMARLKLLEESNDHDPSDYVPVYELGAPRNYLNSLSKVNEELTAARPGTFTGVVVNGGVHMDSMLGGNPLIQYAAYLIAGWPKPQNPPAVQLLMAGWINDMFAENIDPLTGRCTHDCDGGYGDPGETIPIGDQGDASAVVIDSGALPKMVARLLGKAA